MIIGTYTTEETPVAFTKRILWKPFQGGREVWKVYEFSKDKVFYCEATGETIIRQEWDNGFFCEISK